jgi:hypothetical protein
MFTEPVRSDDTIARYEIDATKISANTAGSTRPRFATRRMSVA